MQALPRALAVASILLAASGCLARTEATDAGVVADGGGCAKPCSGACCGSDETCNPGTLKCCKANCSGRSCGSDGCGGTCGTCATGTICDFASGACRSCTPSCAGKQCGDDGCGGACSPGCPQGQKCSGSTCVACTASCAGKRCGPDGCGGLCGSCPAGTACSGSGQCACTPNCVGKFCGSDGCGGQCGFCPTGSRCTASSTCESYPSVDGGVTPSSDAGHTPGNTCSDACNNIATICAAEFAAAKYTFNVQECIDNCRANVKGCTNVQEQIDCVAKASSCSTISTGGACDALGCKKGSDGGTVTTRDGGVRPPLLDAGGPTRIDAGGGSFTCDDACTNIVRLCPGSIDKMTCLDTCIENECGPSEIVCAVYATSCSDVSKCPQCKGP